MSKRGFYDEWEPSDRLPSPTQATPSKQAVLKDEMMIPANYAGLVIGRNGSEIRNILHHTNCRVSVVLGITVSGYRTLELCGTEASIESAKQYINTLIESQKLLNRNPAHHTTVDIMIPANRCGAVIGKGGETMRKLRSLSGCRILMIQENNFANSEKPLRISGPPESVKIAEQLVQELIEKFENFQNPALAGATVMIANGPEAQMSLILKVPRATVGAIMGRGGESIRKLSNESGTKIQFLPDDDPALMDRSLAIIGTKARIRAVTKIIKQIVDANQDSSSKEQALFFLTIPAAKCGLVIGKGGEIIKMINAESGAHCELSRKPEKDINEKTFVIRGTDQQIEYAKHLIGQKVGDIPPGTPFFLGKIEASTPPSISTPPATPQQYQPQQFQLPYTPPQPLQYIPTQVQYQMIPQQSPQQLQYPQQQQVQYPQMAQMFPGINQYIQQRPAPSIVNKFSQELVSNAIKNYRNAQEIKKEVEEEKVDYSHAWLQYYESIGDEKGMAAVRKRMEAKEDK